MEFDDIVPLAQATRDRLLAQLGGGMPAHLEDFLDGAERVGRHDAYKVFPRDVGAVVETVRSQCGVDGMRAFLRAAIAARLLRTLAGPRVGYLPARVRVQQLAQFRRIAADGDETAPWLDLGHDLFHKEFGIAALRLYVAGCQLVDPCCGIPRSLLLRGTPLDWLRNAAMMLALGGRRPFFEIHVHSFMRELFSEEGRKECYRCCAELYALHPEVRGMLAGSWFYDPALERVSPRLRHLRTVPQEAGAWLLCVGATEDAVTNALATSPTRRKLYEEGSYLPKKYMIVWGKARQQAWARALPASSPVGV